MWSHKPEVEGSSPSLTTILSNLHTFLKQFIFTVVKSNIECIKIPKFKSEMQTLDF